MGKLGFLENYETWVAHGELPINHDEHIDDDVDETDRMNDMKTTYLWSTDLPAYGMISGWSTHGTPCPFASSQQRLVTILTLVLVVTSDCLQYDMGNNITIPNKTTSYGIYCLT